jgi:hypothetical protein
MSKLMLTAATALAALGLGACNYTEDYNEQGYNAANADYNADEANYTENAAAYNNTTDYNVANDANAADNMANDSANTADNAVTNNSY